MNEFRKIIANGALITTRDWDDVKTKPLSSITGNPDDKEVLDGIIISGYESKFADGTNTNLERFAPTCLDKFMREYYVEKQLNMPLVIEHRDGDPEWLAGRVVYAEVNEEGFKYVAYIPRDYMHFEVVKNLLKNKILQGFSKFGWATKAQWIDDPDEEYGGYYLVEEMDIVSMSLVTTPANGVKFESMGEIANATRFVHKKKEEQVKDGFAAMFN